MKVQQDLQAPANSAGRPGGLSVGTTAPGMWAGLFWESAEHTVTVKSHVHWCTQHARKHSKINRRRSRGLGTWSRGIWRCSCCCCSRYICAWRRGQNSRAGGQCEGRPWTHRPSSPGADSGGVVEVRGLWCLPGCCCQVWRPSAAWLMLGREAGGCFTWDSAFRCERTDEEMKMKNSSVVLHERCCEQPIVPKIRVFFFFFYQYQTEINQYLKKKLKN